MAGCAVSIVQALEPFAPCAGSQVRSKRTACQVWGVRRSRAPLCDARGHLSASPLCLHGTCSPCLQNDTCTFKGIWGGSHVPDKVVLISSFWWTVLGGGERSSSCRCAAVVLWLYFCMSRGSGRRGTACSIRIHTAGVVMVQTPRACSTRPSGLVPENATGVELTPRDYGALADLACNTPLESYAEVGPAAVRLPPLGQQPCTGWIAEQEMLTRGQEMEQ